MCLGTLADSTAMKAFRAGIYRLGRLLLYRCVVPVLSNVGPLATPAWHVYQMFAQRPVLLGSLPNPIHVDGMILFHDAKRPSVTARALALGTYELSVVKALQSRLRRGMTGLDVRAHLGYDTVVAAQWVGPSGRFWAFEPDPDQQMLLSHNVDANGVRDRVTIESMAVGRESGSVMLHRVSQDSGSSTILGVATAASDINVEVTTLDAWAARCDWPPVNLIKMHVEGSEPDALFGMRELVRRNPDVTLIVECQKQALERNGVSAMRLFDELHVLGFDSIVMMDDVGAARRLRGSLDEAAALERSRWYPINLSCSRTVR